ncbi:hypothetical protein [Kitasatospora sp. NPDC101183]
MANPAADRPEDAAPDRATPTEGERQALRAELADAIVSGEFDLL